ncbi:DUF6376 family protein [Bacillus sp. DX1.1]|uniref:DUF6376 family protein n=1 Tax=unclassified Bacillus (in: firmicutes) TaxID=185979 RepID=UPI0025708567|nr:MULTISPECIES: DUF6376 family protein [unclassified Bacillus (in: firmicutes)]MDM5154496.1 DUF6376 family protein [Bacillus sp. DX1.1]WJE83395.1 DUF6376 family protein [Bacillus sp. DX3.1]
MIMNKTVLLLFMMVFGLMGCSAIEEGKNSIDYFSKATEYINEVSNFASEAPALAEKAINDDAARKELESKLQQIQKDIPAFNELTPPDVAKDIHQQIVDYNEKLNTLIDTSVKNIEAGKMDLAAFENSELMKKVQELKDLAGEIQNLGK